MGGRSGQGTGGGGSGAIANLIDSTSREASSIHKGDIAGYERFVYRDIDGLNERGRALKTTEQLKKEVGGYISTEKIYKRENVQMPTGVKNHIQDLGKSKVDGLINRKETKRIEISKINIIQQYVFEKPLIRAIKENKSKVVLFNYKGKYYLNDGNHRVAAAKLNKRKYINAVIENVK